MRVSLIMVCAAAFVPQAPLKTSTSVSVKRPQLKAAKKHNRRRPKKTRPSDIHRKPPPYNVEPQFCEDRPPEYEVLELGSDDFDAKKHIAELQATLAAEPDYDYTDHELEAKIIASVPYPDYAQAAAALYVRREKKRKERAAKRGKAK